MQKHFGRLSIGQFTIHVIVDARSFLVLKAIVKWTGETFNIHIDLHQSDS